MGTTIRSAAYQAATGRLVPDDARDSELPGFHPHDLATQRTRFDLPLGDDQNLVLRVCRKHGIQAPEQSRVPR